MRQFAPSLLTTLTFQSHKPSDPLLAALEMLRTLNAAGKRTVLRGAPTAFITDAWWADLVEPDGKLNRRYDELAVLWTLRTVLRSGDVFVEHAHRYADSNAYLIPHHAWPARRLGSLALDFSPIL